MKRLQLLALCLLALASVFLTGCRRSADTVWEDSKTASRHMKRGFNSLGGKHGDSRQIQNRGEFMCDDACDFPRQSYTPLQDCQNDADLAMQDFSSLQPKESPGEFGSSIPGIDAFQDPKNDPRLKGVFQTVYFDYNSSLIDSGNSLSTIKNISGYMRSNPRTYIFVEGHCDERGAEAYNLALGSRRSNAVRNLLIQEGVSPDNIFTISYGKERPAVMGHDENSWSLNRRAEFKVYKQ